MTDPHDPSSERSLALDATFGCMPGLEIPSRDEWDRFDAFLDPL